MKRGSNNKMVNTLVDQLLITYIPWRQIQGNSFSSFNGDDSEQVQRIAEPD